MYAIDVYAKSLIGMTRFVELFDFFISPGIFDNMSKREVVLLNIEKNYGVLIKDVIEKILCQYNLNNIYKNFGIHTDALAELLENDLFSNYIINVYLDDEKIKELDQTSLDDIINGSMITEDFDFKQFNFYLEQQKNLDNKTLIALERLFLKYENKK